jgi:protein TonB
VLVGLPEPEAGARDAGSGGLEVGLGPRARANPTPDRPVEEPVEEPAKPEPQPEPEPEPQPEPRPEPQPEPEPEPEPQPQPEPRPEPQPEPEPDEAAEAEEVTAPAETSQAEEASEAEETAEQDLQGDGSSGGGDPGAFEDYRTRLQAWLERHKDYPVAARRRRQEGVVELTFTLRRDGTVAAAEVSRPSGSILLDRAARRMLDRAEPMPAFPDSLPVEEMELTVPVEFRLR